MSWTNYLKKGIASILVLALALVMFVAFGLNKGFDFTGGTIVTVSAKDYTEAEARTNINTAFSGQQNLKITSMSVGTANDEQVFTIKYQVWGDVDAVNLAVENALFDAFEYSQTDPVQQNFITMTEKVQPAYNNTVITYALLGIMVALLAVAFYIWLRLGLGSAVVLVASVVIDVLLALAIMVIFRIEMSANIGYALSAIAGISAIFNTLMLNKLRANSFVEENKKKSNAEIAEITANQTFKNSVIFLGGLAVMLLVFAIIAFGPAGSAVLMVALSLASVFVTTQFIAPNLWQMAYVKKVRTKRTEKAIEIESEEE